MVKLGVGVLGVGEMGKRHAENFCRRLPGARLVAVADLAEDRAKQVAAELEIAQAFGSLEAMLECKGIDALVIATPDKFHAQAVIAAARAGKDILCEKPLALKLADARAAVDAVAKAGVRMQVGFMRRYDAAYVAAKKQIAAGQIGEPLVFKAIGRDKEWGPLGAYQSQVNGMIFYTNTIHDFDMARWLMQDEVAEVHAYTTVSTRPELAQYGDVVASVVNLKYQRGAIGNVESHARAVYGYDVRTEIVGSKGSILVGSVAGTAATFLAAGGGTTVLEDHFLVRFADAYLAEARDFVETIQQDRAPRVTGEDGIKALAIAVAAEKSHKDAKPARVEL
jgi:predicted dehydrogenase